MSGVLPGLGHLWRGRLITGSLAFFGSTVLILLFLVNLYQVSPGLYELLGWGAGWLLWMSFWTVQLKFFPARRVGKLELGIYFVVLLLFINLVVFFYWLTTAVLLW